MRYRAVHPLLVGCVPEGRYEAVLLQQTRWSNGRGRAPLLFEGGAENVLPILPEGIHADVPTLRRASVLVCRGDGEPYVLLREGAAG